VHHRCSEKVRVLRKLKESCRKSGTKPVSKNDVNQSYASFSTYMQALQPYASFSTVSFVRKKERKKRLHNHTHATGRRKNMAVTRSQAAAAPAQASTSQSIRERALKRPQQPIKEKKYEVIVEEEEDSSDPDEDDDVFLVLHPYNRSSFRIAIPKVFRTRDLAEQYAALPMYRNNQTLPHGLVVKSKVLVEPFIYREPYPLNVPQVPEDVIWGV